MSRLDLLALVAVLAVALNCPSCGTPTVEHQPAVAPEPVLPAQAAPVIEPAPGAAEPLAAAAAPSAATAGDDKQPALATVLHGAVLDTEDRPVEGATVALMSDEPDPPATVSGPDGLFMLRVPDGSRGVAAQASHPDHASEWRQLFDDVWSGDAPLFFRLAPVAVVHGRVLDGTGAPLAGARIGVEPGGEASPTAYLSATRGASSCACRAGASCGPRSGSRAALSRPVPSTGWPAVRHRPPSSCAPSTTDPSRSGSWPCRPGARWS